MIRVDNFIVVPYWAFVRELYLPANIPFGSGVI